MSKCIINDIYCVNDARVRCKGLCAKHYSRLLSNGSPTLLKVNTRPRKASIDENWCGRCSNFKSISCFSKSKDRANGLTSICKDCASNRWKSNYDPIVDKFRSIKKKYGLTKEEYQHMLRKQGEVCAICKSATSILHVDHNHTNGKVRGLLCFRCNTTLGRVEDSIELLNGLIKYLEVSNE